MSGHTIALCLTSCVAPLALRAQDALPAPRDTSLPTVFHIGDSTVRNGSGNGANGQWGWGDMMSCYFDTTRVNVVNRALGGRSSRTYLAQGHWDRTLPMIKRGDVVIMQFGHNDASAVTRSTISSRTSTRSSTRSAGTCAASSTTVALAERLPSLRHASRATPG